MPRLTKNPLIVTIVLAHAVFGALWLAAWTGSLEWAELLVYDSLLAESPTAQMTRPPVILVGASDDDVEQLNWPLTDQLLGDLLDQILRAQPKAVGVDLYRSEPRPPGSDRLTEILGSHDNVIMGYKFPDKDGRGIPAPATAQKTGQIGFTDLVLDPGGVIRRGLLFLTGPAGQTGQGFALQLAARALAETGVCLQSDGTAANNLAIGQCVAEGATPSRKPVVVLPVEDSHGGYVGADAGGYQVMLDYREGIHPFPIVGMRDVLNGRVPPEMFQGRVVIIGAAAESVKDFFFTPFSRLVREDQTSFGMEIHAHLIAQLLRYGAGTSKPITALTDIQESVWLWLWCLFGAAMGFRIRSPWAFLSRGVAGVIAIFVAGFIALMAFLWLPVAAPVFGWLLSATLVTSYMSYHEQQDRRALMGLFSQHVSKGVAEELWSQRADFMDGNRPRPQRLVATVLFTDLKGFSTLSEGLDASALMDWLNEYMTTMSQVISLHGGVIDKFIGDAIMVVFGIPKKRETDAEISADALAAVSCVRAMNQALEDLNRDWQRDGKPTIGMRAGIHTGPVVAGAVGGEERMDYTVIGDTVNTAARLESYDKDVVDPDAPDAACRILISETTRIRLGGKFTTLRIGEVSLKGKQQQVEVHLVKLTPNPQEADSRS